MGFKDLVVSSGGGNYLKTPPGATKVRIVSGAVKFWKDFDGKKQYLTEEAAKINPNVKIRYSMWVIDREDGVLKVWECSAPIVRDIVALANNPEYAFEDLPPYDIIINRVGTTQNDTRYTLTPARQNTALTEIEVEEIKKLKKIEMFLREDAEDSGEIKLEDIPF